MGSPNLLFALLIGSVTVSVALKCHYYKKGKSGPSGIAVEQDSRDFLCTRVTVHCAAAAAFPFASDVCTTEDITTGRNVIGGKLVRRSDYTELIEHWYCKIDPNLLPVFRQAFDFGSCDTDLCNDVESSMTIPTCDKPVDEAAAGEASTRSDGRGLLQLFDRNAARATDDARRVLRVLQSIPSEASGAVTGANPPAAVSEANPPSVPVSSSTVSPSAQDPSTAAGTPSPSVSVSSSTAAPPTHAPQAVPVTKAPVSAAVSAAQISGIFWVPALIAVMALTSNA